MKTGVANRLDSVGGNNSLLIFISKNKQSLSTSITTPPKWVFIGNLSEKDNLKFLITFAKLICNSSSAIQRPI